MREDATFLLNRPEFRRWLFTAIQTAGIFDAANGHDGRDLNWIEGRRSLGFELLRMADEGQPEQLRTANALATLNAVILENINSPKKEKPNGGRYTELND